jgi:hypothetical protein
MDADIQARFVEKLLLKNEEQCWQICSCPSSAKEGRTIINLSSDGEDIDATH